MTDVTESKERLLQTVSKYRTQIMGFIAMWIFIFHVRNEAPVFLGVPFLCDVDIFFVNIGFNGVDVFFFLSGWGLYRSINENNVAAFYKRRYRRLVPSYVFACVATVILYNRDIVNFIKAVTCWSFLTKDIHETAWFIPAIAITYLFFPLYNSLFEKARNKYVFAAIAIAVWAVLTIAGDMIFNRTDIYLYVGRIPIFIIGTVFGWFMYTGQKRSLPLVWFMLIIMFIAGIQTEYYVVFKKIELLNAAFSFAVPGILIGIPMCFLMARLFRRLDKVTFIQKIFGFIGNISLEFYAAQDAIIYTLRHRIMASGVPFNKHLFVLIVFLLSLGTGYVLNLVTMAVIGKMDGKPVFTAKEKA